VYWWRFSGLQLIELLNVSPFSKIFQLYRGDQFYWWENCRPAPSHWPTLSHNVVSSTPRLSRVRTRNVIGTDCIGSCKINFRTTTTAPTLDGRLSGYNTESLFVDNNWVTCFGECHTLCTLIKDLFLRFRKRVGALYCCCYKILVFVPTQLSILFQLQ